MSWEVHIDWQGQTRFVGRLHTVERSCAISYGKQTWLLTELWSEAEDWDWADRIEYVPRA